MCKGGLFAEAAGQESLMSGDRQAYLRSSELIQICNKDWGSN